MIKPRIEFESVDGGLSVEVTQRFRLPTETFLRHANTIQGLSVSLNSTEILNGLIEANPLFDDQTKSTLKQIIKSTSANVE